MRKAVIGLSGGMDSVTLVGYLLDKGYEVHCCSFLYGSKHSAYEIEAAKNVVNFYSRLGKPITHKFFDLTGPFESFTSDLLKSGGEIPEGHYNEDSMKRTVVPGRNLILASIMAGYAESIGAEEVYLGIHAGDHHIYPDCRPGFLSTLNSVLAESTEGKVTANAPFLWLTKADILRIGYDLSPNVPYHLTRTCYKDQDLACGKCGSCRERLEAFAEIGKTDPVHYEKD